MMMNDFVKKLISVSVLIAFLLPISVKKGENGRVERVRSLVWEYKDGELAFEFGSPDKIIGAIIKKISSIFKK